MACRYYDDLISEKIKKWAGQKARVLKPDETKRLFETEANDNNDKPLTLPLFALSRDTTIELISNIKQLKSFSGLPLYKDKEKTVQLNVIPIKLQYQLDIYTKTYEEGDEYLREMLFKLINNPTIFIALPYNDSYFTHIANIRVLTSVSDTSSISERIFPGQFTRWSIQFEIQDAFLFSIPYRKNWKLYIDSVELVAPENMSVLNVGEELSDDLIVERLPVDDFELIDTSEEILKK